MGLIKRKVRSVISRKVKRPVKRKVRQAASQATITCGTCGKRYTNPLTHTCTVKTDYRKRQAAEKRRQATAVRRRKAAEKRAAARARRKAAADRRKAAAAARRKTAAKPRTPGARPAASKHDYRTCRDEECERYACTVYRIGHEDGIHDCPLPHGGG
jgi:membrane protein involved in colicin uptake